MLSPDLSLSDAARVVRERWSLVPRVAVVAGSGLGGLAALVEDAVSIGYEELPGVPKAPHVVGHAGRLVCGTLAGVPACVFAGRVHAYQGVSARDAAFTARLASALGADTLIVTNAAGGVSEEYSAGDIVLLSDQVNMTGDSPLVGWPGPPGGNPFVPMRDAFDPELRRRALEAAADVGVPLQPQGVYFGLLGPAYETPAEVEMLKRLGADLVGMSTVAEVIAARALGLRVLGLSLVTNVAAGAHLSHTEVLEAGRVAADNLERLVIGILARLP